GAGRSGLRPAVRGAGGARGGRGGDVRGGRRRGPPPGGAGGAVRDVALGGPTAAGPGRRAAGRRAPGRRGPGSAGRATGRRPPAGGQAPFSPDAPRLTGPGAPRYTRWSVRARLGRVPLGGVPSQERRGGL